MAAMMATMMAKRQVAALQGKSAQIRPVPVASGARVCECESEFECEFECFAPAHVGSHK